MLLRPGDDPGLDGMREDGGFACAELDSAQAMLLERLGPTPVTVDNLLRDTGLSTAIVWTALLELELAGRLERQPGGKVALLL